MTPNKYQSGETDVTGRISKIGDSGVRALSKEKRIALWRTPPTLPPDTPIPDDDALCRENLYDTRG